MFFRRNSVAERRYLQIVESRRDGSSVRQHLIIGERQTCSGSYCLVMRFRINGPIEGRLGRAESISLSRTRRTYISFDVQHSNFGWT